jgi:hypothetical protein
MRGMLWASTLFVGLGLLGSKALGQTGSVNNQRVSLATVDYGDQPVAGSTYVPIDSWIYGTRSALSWPRLESRSMTRLDPRTPCGNCFAIRLRIPRSACRHLPSYESIRGSRVIKTLTSRTFVCSWRFLVPAVRAMLSFGQLQQRYSKA